MCTAAMAAPGMPALPRSMDSLAAGNGVDRRELGRALRRCRDPLFLRNTTLVNLPGVARRIANSSPPPDLGKALRQELLYCAESVTWRRKQPIAFIVSAVANGRNRPNTEEIERVKAMVGVPLGRNEVDLARYYTIRLVMEGVPIEAIAGFLEVEPRTVANYISQAKEHIALVLESRR